VDKSTPLKTRRSTILWHQSSCSSFCDKSSWNTLYATFNGNNVDIGPYSIPSSCIKYSMLLQIQVDSSETLNSSGRMKESVSMEMVLLVNSGNRNSSCSRCIVQMIRKAHRWVKAFATNTLGNQNDSRKSASRKEYEAVLVNVDQ